MDNIPKLPYTDQDLEEERSLRVLVIAEGKYPSQVDSISYAVLFEGDGVNIGDYDVVIMDLTEMDPERAKTIFESPLLGKKRIHDHLWARHDLILILDKQIMTHRNLLQNLPVIINLTVERGSVVSIKEEFYKEYFEIHVGNQWDYCLQMDVSPFFQDVLSLPFTWEPFYHLTAIALNNYNKPISFEVYYGYRQKEGSRRDISGKIIILQPPHKSGSVEQAIRTLLSNYGFQIETEAPSWISDLAVPGEMEKEKKISLRKEEIQKIEKEIDDLVRSKDKLTYCKKVLYECEDTLRDVVWDVLEEIGLEVNRYDEKKEDGSITWDSEVILLEVKGSNRSAKTKDLRELSDWINRYSQEHLGEIEKIPRGLMIINHYRFIHPKERDEPFPNDIRRFIDLSAVEICAMTTSQLFDMYCRIKNGEIEEDEIRRKIVTTTGVFEWDVKWELILKNLKT